MFFFFFIFITFVLSTTGMEAPLAKRKGDQLESVTKLARGSFGEPTLEGIPTGVTQIILGFVMSANGAWPEAKISSRQEIDFTFKTFHPCLLVNKKFNRLSNKALSALFVRLQEKYPKSFLQVINDTCISDINVSFFEHFIVSNPNLVFDLTPRITPLMFVVGYNKEDRVDLLLKHTPKEKLKSYLDLKCGSDARDIQIHQSKYGFKFNCHAHFTALHVAAAADNVVSISILKKLLIAGASPNLLDQVDTTPLVRVLADTEGQSIETDTEELIEKVSTLLQYGANPYIGMVLEEESTPYDHVKNDIESVDPTPHYLSFWKLFNFQRVE